MSASVQVRFLPGPFIAKVETGSTLLAAARQAHAPIEAPCDGAGICGKCLVRLEPEALASLESGAELREGNGLGEFVLACAAHVRSALTAIIPERRDKDLAIVDHGLAIPRPLAPHIAVVHASDGSTVWGGQELLASLPNCVANLGIAVDIGTTTLVVSLVDLDRGEELAVASALNPQSSYGHDVLSRSHFAAEPDGLATMQRVLVDELNVLI
ncbi:MAG TPA: 2Fe-2S iron-sulfur cluster-binding protein, partial [Polyangia bacterium]